MQGSRTREVATALGCVFGCLLHAFRGVRRDCREQTYARWILGGTCDIAVVESGEDAVSVM